MGQCHYEALSYLWSGVQGWGTGKHLLSAMADLYKLTFMSSISDSYLGRDDDPGDDINKGRSVSVESGLAIYERQRQNDAACDNAVRFRLVSLSTIISHITGRIQQLETGDVGVGKLHSECMHIKGILEALKCACDKSSCMEYVFFLAFKCRI
jgi:hypothetical protein